MLKNHLKYIIQKGDTLLSIATAHGLSIDELRIYHNTYCPIPDLLGYKLPSDAKEIFLPTEKTTKQEATYDSIDTVLLQKEKKAPTFYGVMITIENDNNINTIKYETSITFLKKINECDYIYEINRTSKTFINDSEPDSIADCLAVEVGSVLYPLQICVSKEGNFISIVNFDAILKRWNLKKEILNQYYKGEWAEKYILLTEQGMRDEEILYRSLKNDWFLTAFFNGIYDNYSEKRTVEKNMHFPFFSFIEPVEYDTNISLASNLDEYGLIQIEMNGKISDARSKADLESRFSIPYYGNQEGATKATGVFYGMYFLEPNLGIIESLFVECILDLKETQKVSIVVSNLNENVGGFTKYNNTNLFIEEDIKTR